MSNYETTIKFKVIKSILDKSSIILEHMYVKLYTANKDQRSWLYSGLNGILFLTIDQQKKKPALKLFSTTASLLFEYEFDSAFTGNYERLTTTMHFFEVGTGFIAFKFNDTNKGDSFFNRVKSLKDEVVKKILSSSLIQKDFEIENTYQTILKILKNKLSQEFLFKSSSLSESEVLFSHSKVVDLLKKIMFYNGNVVFQGSRGDIRDLGFESTLEFAFTDQSTLKIKDSRIEVLESKVKDL